MSEIVDITCPHCGKPSKHRVQPASIQLIDPNPQSRSTGGKNIPKKNNTNLSKKISNFIEKAERIAAIIIVIGVFIYLFYSALK